MPDKPPGALIREHGEQIVSLGARVDHLRQDLVRVEMNIGRTEKNSDETRHHIEEVDKRLVVVARDVERLEKKVDDLLLRRWELSKLVLAAFLGSLLTLGTGVAIKSLDRFITPGGWGPASEPGPRPIAPRSRTPATPP